jgi:hypothetical protein
MTGRALANDAVIVTAANARTMDRPAILALAK